MLQRVGRVPKHWQQLERLGEKMEKLEELGPLGQSRQTDVHHVPML